MYRLDWPRYCVADKLTAARLQLDTEFFIGGQRRACGLEGEIEKIQSAEYFEDNQMHDLLCAEVDRISSLIKPGDIFRARGGVMNSPFFFPEERCSLAQYSALRFYYSLALDALAPP
jgi:hypothetical protein